MRKQDPQNGVGWSGDISRANVAKDEEALDAAIGAAGRAKQFNSYFMTLAARLSEATAMSKSMPLNDAIIAVSGELAGLGLPEYGSISNGCAVERMKRPGRLEFCGQRESYSWLGTHCLQKGSAWLSRSAPSRLTRRSGNSRLQTVCRNIAARPSATLNRLGNWDEVRRGELPAPDQAHPREQDVLCCPSSWPTTSIRRRPTTGASRRFRRRFGGMALPEGFEPSYQP